MPPKVTPTKPASKAGAKDTVQKKSFVAASGSKKSKSPALFTAKPAKAVVSSQPIRGGGGGGGGGNGGRARGGKGAALLLVANTIINDGEGRVSRSGKRFAVAQTFKCCCGPDTCLQYQKIINELDVPAHTTCVSCQGRCHTCHE